MKTQSNSVRTGMVLGAMVGGLHFFWSILVLLGIAKPFLDFVFSMHFIKLNYEIEPFHFGKALLLVLITSSIGFGLGFIFSKIWNKLHH